MDQKIDQKLTQKIYQKLSKTLPSEQMFELMKEMKECVQNNPHEARNMLLQNPQLAYALLQAQVVMRIVDPDIAMKMLHRQQTVQPLVHNTRSAAPATERAGRLDSHISSLNRPGAAAGAAGASRSQARPVAAPSASTTAPLPASAQSAMASMSGTDREKAALITQVMNLTHEQIEMLPASQRKSIIELREQLQATVPMGKK